MLPYVSTHNPRNNEAYSIIYQNLPMLKRDTRMNRVLQTHSIIKSKRQPKSLKRILTSAQLCSKTTESTVKKCGRSNCRICLNLSEGPEFHFKQGQCFKV